MHELQQYVLCKYAHYPPPLKLSGRSLIISPQSNIILSPVFELTELGSSLIIRL